MIISFYGGSNWRWQFIFSFKINDESIILQKCRYAFKCLKDSDIENDKMIEDGGEIIYYYPKKGILKSMKMNKATIGKKVNKLEKKEIELKNLIYIKFQMNY